MSSPGDTSNPGLNTGHPSGATGTSSIWVISVAERSSIGICEPSGKVGSKVELGAAI